MGHLSNWGLLSGKPGFTSGLHNYYCVAWFATQQLVLVGTRFVSDKYLREYSSQLVNLKEHNGYVVAFWPTTYRRYESTTANELPWARNVPARNGNAWNGNA